MDKLNLKDFPEDTYVYLETPFRKILFDKLEKKYISLKRAGIKLNIPPCEMYYYKIGNQIKNKKIKRFIPLKNLVKICIDLEIDLDQIQHKISELKTSSRSGIIKNPKLPLEIKPETFAILGHFIGDGYGGENGNACYVNISPEARQNFIDKLRIAFGDVYFSASDKHNRVVVSKLVPKILKKYFGIDDFRGSKSKLSQKVFDAPRDCLVELVKASIIDEGRVTDSIIEIEFSSNPKLTFDYMKICQERLGYKCGKYSKNFYISHESFESLSKDMKTLVIPSKQIMLQKWFNRKERTWYNKKSGATKKEIIGKLLEKPMTVSELAMSLGIRVEAVRKQIKGYAKKGRNFSGLYDLKLVKPQNERAWMDAEVFEVIDRDKALAYLNGE